MSARRRDAMKGKRVARPVPRERPALGEQTVPRRAGEEVGF